jgi:hypothetical protein
LWKSMFCPQGYTLWFSLFSLKLNIFPFSASILTFSMQNHLILTYFTHFDIILVFIEKMGCIKMCKICLKFPILYSARCICLKVAVSPFHEIRRWVPVLNVVSNYCRFFIVHVFFTVTNIPLRHELKDVFCILYL